MIDYIKVDRRSGTTTRCVEMVNAAAEAGKRVAIVAPRMAQLRALEGLDERVYLLPIGNPVAGCRFDEIVVDYNDSSPSSRYREWLECALASRLHGPDARMTVFHT